VPKGHYVTAVYSFFYVLHSTSKAIWGGGGEMWTAEWSANGNLRTSPWFGLDDLVYIPKWTQHFKGNADFSKRKFCLLWMDIPIICTYVKNHGIMSLYLPPHCIRHLQLLDLSLYEFKVIEWLKCHPGGITHYETVGLSWQGLYKSQLVEKIF
jgi:hypothetical protein